MTVTVPLFVNGGGMRGGNVHHSIAGLPFLGEARTAPRYRFFSVRDEFPGLWPVAEGGVSVPGELYDVPLDVIRDRFIPAEPPELELERDRAGGRRQRGGRGAALGRPRVGRRPDRHLRCRRLARVPRRAGVDEMADFDLVIRGKRVITRAGEVPRCIAVRDGVVVAIEPLEAGAARGSTRSTWPTTRCCCPAWSTPTCTSTSRVAPSGKASRPRPAPRRPAA